MHLVKVYLGELGRVSFGRDNQEPHGCCLLEMNRLRDLP